ncbi:MAG TPA: zinc-binding alcohol dehydrogenase family protein [Tepidisphaeraceae bacterium]|jgi:2-desacetyl-2-hydroxyethyl bacteriochlorophyllide A dehydrogenase|nr:zinc-binding alcohol dehydrogenase family protein [Tepidisphaeraceae bacterium]
MKTIVLNKPGELRQAETDAPHDVPMGFALVRVNRVGVCGTDWHAYRGDQPFFSYPRILGHELAVVVERVNDPGGNLKTGDRCAVEPYLNCGRCVACRAGKPNCCVNLKVMGVHVDGGMREWLLAPTAKLHRSEKLSLDELALVEPLSIGCHAVDRAGIVAGESVLVIGAGPIGLSVIPFATAAGARVIVMDISASRLEFCRKKMGVKTTLDAGDGNAAAKLDELPSCIIDATGNPRSMARCFDLAAHGGRIVFVGLFQGDLSFNDPNFHRRELTLMATRNSRPADFRRIIAMAERNEIDTKPWITHRIGVDRLIEEFPKWAADAGVLKAIIEF